MGWPCFKESRWKHIRREAEKEMKHLDAPVIFASDKNPAACRELEDSIRKYNLSGTVRVIQKDFFDLTPTDIQLSGQVLTRGLVVINPPYGRRLETKAASVKLLDEICRKLKQDFKGWQFALIASDKQAAGKIPFKARTYELLHGGLKLGLMVGRI
jgi:putative N6-adenine-specific DNA methylase